MTIDIILGLCETVKNNIVCVVYYQTTQAQVKASFWLGGGELYESRA